MRSNLVISSVLSNECVTHCVELNGSPNIFVQEFGNTSVITAIHSQGTDSNPCAPYLKFESQLQCENTVAHPVVIESALHLHDDISVEHHVLTLVAKETSLFLLDDLEYKEHTLVGNKTALLSLQYDEPKELIFEHETKV